jgi:hypothetical protein
MYANAPTRPCGAWSNGRAFGHAEKIMYYGGGILGTILIVVLIVYFIRRT